MAKPNIAATAAQSMRDYWRLYMAEGIAVSVLGLAAIIVPSIAGLFAPVVFGWLLFIAGIVGLTSDVIITNMNIRSRNINSSSSKP
jgi:uncharacterized membrane protein HdeD (DUF308 family)